MDLLIPILVVVGLLVAALLTWMLVGRRDETSSRSPAPGIQAPADDPLAAGVTRTSRSLGVALRAVLGRGEVDETLWEAMEEALIGADVGVAAAGEIVARVKDQKPKTTEEARAGLRQALILELSGRSRELTLGDNKPAVVLVVGVNGTGKTTTIAKLAKRLQGEGREPLLGAADTFRAAADTQLRTWGERLGCEVVGGQEGSDPASVAFDAFTAARARGRDVVIVDTAGRLQAKHNLMAELSKIKRVLEREAGAVDEVLLVLDATGGQNGISQVEVFTRTVGVSGIVLTKLDGTARGGIVVAVERDLGVPVKYVGVGEGLSDLIPFDPAVFVDALLADA